MNSKLLTTWLASALAAATVAAAVLAVRDARVANAELAVVKEKRDALAAKIADTERKIVRAEDRANEAEKDSGELLKAVAAVRAQQAVPVASEAGGVIGSVASPTGAGLADARAVPNAAGGVTYQTQVVDGRTVTTATYGGAGVVSHDAEEAERLARERSYQQELAKRRAEEATAKAQIAEEASHLDPAAKFARLIAAAESYAAKADFQAATRFYNQAMEAKPVELPVPDNVKALQTTLQAQNAPIEVTFSSDGLTWVSIANVRAPRQFTMETFKLLPGDYVVRGLRKGYRDVVIKLSVRAGVMPSPVTVICTELAP